MHLLAAFTSIERGNHIQKEQNVAFSSVSLSLHFHAPCLSQLRTHTHSHFILIFTLVSTGPSAINCVPDWDHRRSVAGSAGCIQERGRQGWAQLSPEEEATLSYRCPHPSSEYSSKLTVPEDGNHKKKIDCFLQVYLRITQAIYARLGSSSQAFSFS